jgi:hypothetical protein
MNFSDLTIQFRSLVLAAVLLIVPGIVLPAAEPRRLTSDGTLKFAPVANMSGREIYFSAHESPTLVALFRFQVETGVRTRLHPAVTAHQFDAAVSADGDWHCYAMSSGSPQMVLVIQRPESFISARDGSPRLRDLGCPGAPNCFGQSQRGGPAVSHPGGGNQLLAGVFTGWYPGGIWLES